MALADAGNRYSDMDLNNKKLGVEKWATPKVKLTLRRKI